MLKKVIIALVALMLLLLLMGSLLPMDYVVERSIFIDGDPLEIHESIVNLRSWPEWTPWNSQLDPTMVFSYSEGKPGVGFKSRWTGESAGNGNLEITSAEPGRGIVYVLNFEGFPTVDGVIEIQQMKGGCNVRWKASGQLKPPLGGLMVMMMDSAMGADFASALDGLKERNMKQSEK